MTRRVSQDQVLETLQNAIGPGGLRAPPEVAFECVAGHCYYFQSFLSHFPLLSTSFAFDPLLETPEAEILFPPIFWHN